MKSNTRSVLRPSAPRQRWLELDGLAQQYLALPVEDSVEREALRLRILRLLAAGWVSFTADGTSTREDDVLSRTFREQAAALSRRHANHSLEHIYGGLDNLGDEAKAEFLARRASKAGHAGQTLLTGLLSQWNPAKSDLRGFMQAVVRNFLLDLHRKAYKREDGLNGAPPGATPRGFLTDGRAPGDEGDADGSTGHDDWLEAVTHAHGVDGSPHSAEDEAAQTEELFQALEAARDALPPQQRSTYDSEIERHSGPRTTDAAQAAAAGISRNTLYKRRAELAAALNKLMHNTATAPKS
ncbi:hypothetical protein [Pseudaquabacterium rugosum]|uniref:Sigma-70 family RNA polymerase sigma factor n=1 Tax=Pseudaquabacterium rugosum TaxID=2984194 RepID=A0ABU9BCS5_9BURK